MAGIARFSQVGKFYEMGKPELAWQKLDFITAQEPLPDNELWYVENLRFLIALQLGEIEKGLAHLRLSLDSTVGQPLGRQQYNYSNLLFAQHYSACDTDEQRRQDTMRYHLFEQAVQPFSHARQARHERLRIGYLSCGGFNDGVISNFAIQLLGSYDKQRFEVYGYDCSDKKADALADEISTWAAGWYQKPEGEDFSPQQAAERIYKDEIDILVDLSGHSEGGQTMQVAAYRPAPVQMSAIGYMSSTGMERMDYFLGDPYCDPVGQSERDFSEELLRLPHSHFCYTPSELAYHTERQRQAHEGVVFGSFNNLLKVNDAVLAAWSEILRRVPGSSLLLKSSEKMVSSMQRAFRKRAEAAGISPDRICIEAAELGYMARYNAMDIALDTFPYVGGGTTCDALYMGVPVVSLYGQRHGTRFGYSILCNAGLKELAAGTVEEYVEKAVQLALDKELLAALHEEIPGMFRRSPVMDAAGYMREMEEAYERIWQKWLTGG